MNVSPATRTVTDAAGSTTFDVTANTSWTVSSDAAWCTVTTTGSGNGVITATYQKNTTQVIRTANIMVQGAGTLPASVKVIQLPSNVSVGDAPANTFQVFPNPTTGVFVVSSPSSDMLDMNVKIFDLHGKTILTKQCKGEKSYTFDLSQAGKGNYFMQIEMGGQTHTIKIIVQ